MPKLKSNSAAKKRFRVTKNGKVVCAKGFKSHLLSSKTTKRKRNLRGTGVLGESETARVKNLLPYA